MKGKSSVLSAVLILTLGVVLLIINKSLSAAGIVTCGGVLFLLASVLNIFFFLNEDTRHTSGRRTGGALSRIYGWITSVAGIILGLCMLIFESVFVPLIPYIFGGLLLLGGIFHFYVLAISYRPIVFPSWLYAIPALLVAVGVWVCFLDATGGNRMMMILTGSGLCLFALGVFIEGVFIYSYNKNLRKAATTASASPRHDVEEVHAEEVEAHDAHETSTSVTTTHSNAEK